MYHLLWGGARAWTGAGAGYPNLAAALAVPALFGGARPIDDLIKGIGDYAYTAAVGAFQHFAHSERAAILCLLYDANHSIEAAVNTLPPIVGAVPPIQIISQIKIIHPTGICRSCGVLLGNRADVNALALPNAFGAAVIIRNVATFSMIVFQSAGAVACDIHNWLRLKSGLGAGDTFSIRLSYSPAEIVF